MEIKSTKNQELMKINALIYSASGNGKTLIIATDPGLLSLMDADIDSTSPKNWVELVEIYKELLTPEMQKKYDNIFFDGLTDANEMCKEHIVKVERPGIKKDIGKVYEDILTLQDYGLLQTKMSRLILSYIKLPYNIIFTALQDTRKDEKTGAENFYPSLNGKLALNLAGYFDFVLPLGVKDTGDAVERYFLTEKSEQFIAKDRSGKLDRLESPNWTNIINKIKGNKTKGEKK